MSRNFCLRLLCMLAWLSAAQIVADDHRSWRFDDVPAGALPSDWSSAKTGEGPGSDWKVVAAERDGRQNQALAQTSSAGPRPVYNLCVLGNEQHRDVDLSVDVKALSGQIDQGGGLVWRYRDANNYYVARWNPLEDNFRVYHVVAGKRTQLASADVKLPPKEWHTVRAVDRGSHIQCYLDGRLLLDVMDQTFPDAGAIGLWSKADAVTWFDNLMINALPQE